MRFSLRCVITGHEYRISHERGRMFLRCAHCRQETTGWRLDAKPAVGTPRRVAPGHVVLRSVPVRAGH